MPCCAQVWMDVWRSGVDGVLEDVVDVWRSGVDDVLEDVVDVLRSGVDGYVALRCG